MIDRRMMMQAALAAIAAPISTGAAAETTMSRITAYAFSFPALSGESDIRLADYTGRPLLVVNTASLCGYTPQTTGQALPAFELVRELTKLRAFCICEGGVRSPADVRAALDAGADAVVVGSAITNVDWLVREFAGAADRVS